MYTEKFKQLVKLYESMEIEFPHLKTITLAQWAHESARGTSMLAREHNNFGGMMWRDEMLMWGIGISHITYTSQSDNITTQYVKCPSLESWIKCYWKFIERAPYKGWRSFFAGSGERYIQFLKSCGYATDPDYVHKVLKFIPEIMELRSNIKDDTHSEGERMPTPDIVKTSPNKSTRTGTISGLVLHNTAGSFDGSVAWLCNPNARASAHLVISRAGKVAQLVPFGETAWHAGVGRVNHTTIGIEIEATNSQRGMTESQEKKVIDWCKHLMNMYKIKPEGVIIHRMVSNTDCPVLIWPKDEDFIAWRKKNLEGKQETPKPVDKKVTWYDVFDLGGGEVGIAAMAGSEAVELLRAPTSLAFSKFLAEHGDHNVRHAPSGKKWPGAVE